MKIKLTILIISILLLIPTTYAGNEIVDYLGSLIYQDCQGIGISLSPVIHRLEPEIKSLVGNKITKDTIKKIVKVIVDNEPYDMQATVFTTNSDKSGKGLIICGDKQLDINFNSYRWGGERIDPFQYNLNQIIQSVNGTTTEKVSQIAVQGSGNTIDTGGKTHKNEFQNSKLSFIDNLNVNVNVIFYFILTIGILCLEYKFKIIKIILSKFSKNKTK